MAAPLRSGLLLAAALAAASGTAAGAPPAAGAAAPSAAAPPSSTPPPSGQTESDDYTRYELLDPASSSFHILYDVTATRPGADTYFNPIRKGSEASGEAVYDRATGRALRIEVVGGDEARAGGVDDADRDMRYLRIHLARPVPHEGGVRLLIDKTYKDVKSYYRKGADRIVFARPLGVRRNAIVLPAGFELVACNVPSQVLQEADGRLKVSFMHTGPDAAPLVLEARRLATTPPLGTGAAAPAPARLSAPFIPTSHRAPPTAAPPADPPGTLPSLAAPPPAGGGVTVPLAERLSERAHQDRTIVYLLRQPESHAFDLYHDYTESRAGTDKYLNVVRRGSTSSNPAARNLDTGEVLHVETLRGEALRHAGLSVAELAEIAGENGDIAPDTEVVVARFAPVAPGESVRLRISETYTDPRSYRLDGDLLVFDRTFGRPRDAVVLPGGWYLTASAIPAVVSELPDGRIRLDFQNPRPDEIAVLVEARRRPAAAATTPAAAPVTAP